MDSPSSERHYSAIQPIYFWAVCVVLCCCAVYNAVACMMTHEHIRLHKKHTDRGGKILFFLNSSTFTVFCFCFLGGRAWEYGSHAYPARVAVLISAFSTWWHCRGWVGSTGSQGLEEKKWGEGGRVLILFPFRVKSLTGHRLT